MNLSKITHKTLSIEDWKTIDDQTWCILDGNTSNRSRIASIISGDLKPESGTVNDLPKRCALVSLKAQQELYEEELKNEDTDFMDRIDYGSTGAELLDQTNADLAKRTEVVKLLSIQNLLDQHFRLYSSGEARKILIAQAILSAPDLLILDDPFEGLDKESRAHLQAACATLIQEGQAILFLVSKLCDVPGCSTHLGVLSNGKFIAQGPKNELLDSTEIQHLFHFDSTTLEKLPPPPAQSELSNEDLVILKNGSIRYGDVVQFENFDWSLNKGEHTIICGPNGAGKSTLLQLISGDHPQCYSNDLQVFGYQRGSGESIWDIKKHIGIVSASLHRDYRATGTALATVISGLYDSIGLYTTPTAKDKHLAMNWLSLIGMAEHSDTYFSQLSWGQQRLVLIARGLIKQPPLLILDEPTQGLDDINRQIVLAFIERLAALEQTTLLFVSHREDEHLPLFKHRVDFTLSEEPSVRFIARASSP